MSNKSIIYPTKKDIEIDPYEAYDHVSFEHSHYHLRSLAYVESGDFDRASRCQRVSATQQVKRELAVARIAELQANAIDRQEHHFGEFFHTALRKGVDTQASVLLYNLVHVLCSDDETPNKNRVWKNFCDYCNTGWKGGLSPSVVVQKWANKIFVGNMHDDREAYAYYAFRSAIKLTDNTTWNELDNTIDYWVKEYAKH